MTTAWWNHLQGDAADADASASGRPPLPSGAVDSVIELIGRTPLVRLRRAVEGGADIFAKVEFVNPGGSVKDRIAAVMVDRAERDGSISAGGTIVEATSGNTGIGLAMVAALRGYRCVLTVPDKTSTEKIALLQAHGADVVVCPSGLPLEHPGHVRSTAERLAREIRGAWLADQYHNRANSDAHYATTGPEVWAQTDGRVTHFVAGVGTGGTITGVARYLKERNPSIEVVGADPEASVYAGGDGRPYFVESIGHFVHPETVVDIWPSVYDRHLVDRFERVGDRESFAAAASLARSDGLLVGGSAGTALAAARRVAAGASPDALVVVLLPDSGRSYLSKIYDDDWMVANGFADRAGAVATVAAVLAGAGVRYADPDDTVADVLAGGDRGAVVVTAVRPPVVRAQVAAVVDAGALRQALDGGLVAAGTPLRAVPGAEHGFVGSGEDAAVAAAGTAAFTVVVHDGFVSAVAPTAALAGRPSSG